MEMTIDEALRKGTEAHDAGDIQLADSCFTAILKAQPTHPDANHNLGVIAIQTGKPEQAIDFFNRAVEGNPSNTLYWLHYIKTLKNIYRVNEAKEILEQAKKNGLSGGQLSELEREIDTLILDGTIFPNEEPPSEQSQFLLDIYNKGYVQETIVQTKRLLHNFPDSAFLLGLQGAANASLGNALESLENFNKFLELQPDNPEAHYNVANSLRDIGRLDEAIESYHKAYTIRPDFPEAVYNAGYVQLVLGDLDSAIDRFKQAIKINPEFSEAFNNLGNIYRERKQLIEAEQSFIKAIQINPDYAEAHNNLGTVYRDKSELDAASVSFQKALEIKPNFAEGHHNLGLTNRERGSLELASENFQRALDFKPDFAEAHYNMGLILHEKNFSEAAEDSFKKAVELKPDYCEALNHLGVKSLDRGSFSDAIKLFKDAIAVKRDFAEAHNNLGAALYGKGDIDGAIDHYNQALEIKPDFGKAHSNIATVYNDRGYLVEAIESYQNAIDFSPSLTEAHSQLIHLIGSTGNWGAIEKKIDLIKSLGLSGDSVIPFCMLPLDDAPSRQNKRAELYAQQRFTNNPLPPILRPNKPPSRLRIGYFSADFYDHTVTHLICRMLELHDTEKFEIYAYSFSPKKEDAMRMKVIDAVDSFRDIHDMSDMDAAMLAREDKIDIAVDLTGYTKNCRSGIFAYHAAPIQINYLGYPGTMGADFMDYIITDQILVPEDSRQYLSEKVIQMPYSYMVTNNTREVSAREITRSEMGLPEDGFVFCVFNNSYKISPREFDIWTRLLLKVEGSVLWMRHSNKWADENLRKEAQKRDIDPDRLVFAERVPLDEHLARHQLADLFLDTFTFNAHSTAVDALWAGLPVLTKLGYSFAARVAGSLLSAVGMEDLITNTEQEYEDLALELASDPDKLNQLRQKLDTNRLTTPLFDTEQFTKYLENGYQQAYQIYSKGDNTDNIVIKH
jgi:protein O-GlcNAc transferase